MIKLGILSSTRGTDVQAIIDAINSKKINAAISVVISNKKDAFALERAKRHGITAVFIDASNKDRECYDKEAAKELDKSNVDLILLIGYMRSLSPWFVRKYKDKIINIHPSLLPAFAGGMDKDVHKEVLEHGCKITGCTLHFVNESLDAGPIIMQKAVEIDNDETADSLKEKVQKAEQEILVRAIALFEKEKIKIDGRKVRIDEYILKND